MSSWAGTRLFGRPVGQSTQVSLHTSSLTEFSPADQNHPLMKQGSCHWPVSFCVTLSRRMTARIKSNIKFIANSKARKYGTTKDATWLVKLSSRVTE